MEIQFTIPIVKGNASTGNRSAKASAKNVANSARGGTGRFALESRARHTRKSTTRARTGCTTCKKRHVKCDETRPACKNCLKWRGYCDAYGDDPVDGKYQPGSPQDGTLIHTKPAPLILVEPSINSVRFSDGDQRAYFDEWAKLSVSFLSGGLVQTRLWTATLPQLSMEETTLRYGAMAIGALRAAMRVTEYCTDLTPDNRHYMKAISYYCTALSMQAKAAPTQEGLRTALLSSLLFICFETQRGNLPAALKHITHGFTMLNELANCGDKAPDLVRIATAPPEMVQEILDCYKPLELQSRSFMGSYKKFFFIPNKPNGPPSGQAGGPPPPPQGQGDAIMLSPSTPQAQQTSSPAQTPPNTNTTWSQKPQSSTNYTGLPSPQSQDSPIRHTSPGNPPPPHPQQPPHQQPPQTPPHQQPPQTPPPRRPPGIQPFSKHSPYFRPILSHITSLEEMPAVFNSIEETQAYWGLVQRSMVRSLPLLTMTTSKLALPRAKSEAEVEVKLASIKQNPQLSAFVADSRYWIQRWYAAYDPLYQSCVRNASSNRQAYLSSINMRIEYLILSIYTTMPRYSGLITARGLTPYYREMMDHAEELLKARPSCGFAMDTGWTWPLFVVAFGCRDADVRANAIRILGQYPIRNALRDSRVFRAIAIKNEALEQTIAMEGNETIQWLRMRRREVLFEDFGSSVIFRSPVKNEFTGEWEMIEEAADFTIYDDGLLRWKRQPITDAGSILGGVC